MPKTQRDIYRRTLAQAYINLNWAGTYILDLYNTFNPVHPELGVMLAAVLEGIALNTEVLQQFAGDAWGNYNPDWQSWAATGQATHGVYTNPNEALPDTAEIPDKPHINEDKEDGS